MITDKQLKEKDLDELYDWVDSLSLSRPKKNISRDFSDGVMMAQAVAFHYPKIIDIHNYPATSSVKSKLQNWVTLNNKVLSKIGLALTSEDCRRLSNSTPSAIQAVLFQFKKFVDDTNRERQQQENSFPDPYGNQEPIKKGEQEGIAAKLYTASKVEQLREVLSLLRQKIGLVQRSIQRKDAHIRELQQMIKSYS